MAASGRQAVPISLQSLVARTSEEGPCRAIGALAQLGEHLLCKQRVIGSIPIGSTIVRCADDAKQRSCAAVGLVPVTERHRKVRVGSSGG